MPYPRSPLFVALALALAIAAGAASLSGVPAPALSLGWYGAACDDAEAQNPGDPSGCRYEASEKDCGDGVDNDSDERADSQDPDCGHGDPVCLNEAAYNAGEIGECAPGVAAGHCEDGLDNDGDGAYDCSDADCGDAPACRVCAAVVEVCDNGYDDDCDTLVDGEDQDCGCTDSWYNVWQPRCACPKTEQDANGDCAPETYWWGGACADGYDNDGDLSVDCNDADCAGDAACRTGCTGASYCDQSCPEYHPCACDPSADGCRLDCPVGWAPAYRDGVYSCFQLPAENCGNGIDDDADSAIDCADADCTGVAGCISQTEICGNGADDDADGLIDCGDGDCANDPSCGGGGCTGSFCECNPSDPSCQGETCGNGTCGGEEDCATCAADCGKCPPKYEICGNGEDDDENGAADCEDSACSGTCECTNDCGCTGDDCGGACDDSAACNYGEYEACTYCECDGIDNNDDGSTDEEGETCDGSVSGCTDPGATNYDPKANDPEEESCEYSYGCSATVDGTTPIAAIFGGQMASAFGALGGQIAGDPSNIAGADFFFRISLWKNKQGKWSASVSPQVALTTWDGKHPMGAIQAGPSASFNGSGLTSTPPYVTDDHLQREIHRAIDTGFFGKWMAGFHTQLQKKCDVKNWFNRKN